MTDLSQLTNTEASIALRNWQDSRGLPDDVRIERLMADFFKPPIDLDVRYQDQLNAVAEAMAHV